VKRHGARALAVTVLVLAAVAAVSGVSPGRVPPVAARSPDASTGARPLAAPADTLREVVLAEIRDYYDDLSARDWPAFQAHFWPGATITTVWQPPGEDRPRILIQTIHEFVRRAPEGLGSKPVFEERMRDAEVKVGEKLAQVWARYDARFGDPGAVREWQGTDAFTLLEHDGSWRIAALVFAGD
jgi:hypothetical protein